MKKITWLALVLGLLGAIIYFLSKVVETKNEVPQNKD